MFKNISSFFKSRTLTTGFAMFAMFFGAGNVVFPLGVGQYAQDGNIYAIFGLLITAVGVPFLGLLSMTLYEGDYHKFFGRVGKTPGYIIALAIIVLIGPLGAMPRTLALSYSTTKMFWDDITLPWFSFVSCVVIFLLTFRKNKIVDIIGKYLTPILLITMGVIIVKGLVMGHEVPETNHSPTGLFLHGLSEGYQTMDLLATFFFPLVIIAGLRQAAKEEDGDTSTKTIMRKTLKASVVGAILLGLVYFGLSFVAAAWGGSLVMTSQEYFLGTLALEILGPYGGLFACVAVALACLTTAIALAAVTSEFIHEDFFGGRVGYLPCLVGVIIVNYFVSILDFQGIMEFLGPIMEICYPALILLTILNMAHKLWNFNSVKIPTACIFFFSLFSTLC